MIYKDNASFVRDAVSVADRPAARLQSAGSEVLRDAELVSIVIGDDGRATKMVTEFPPERLVAMGLKELRAAGFGASAAIRAVATFELARRGLRKGLGVLPIISSPADAVTFLTEIRAARKEHFLCLYLNARNQVIHREVVSIGSLSASIVHPREVFQVAIVHSAASIILAHNHPSNETAPSRDDIDLTRRMVEAGRIMGIDVLDHLIICESGFLSLKEQGLM